MTTMEECTIWAGPLTNDRPVNTQYKRKQVFIQRDAYERAHGVTLEPWAHVEMVCGNVLCVTSSHVLLTGTIEHFWTRVNLAGPGDCWEWTHGKQNGYGRYVMNGGTLNAHRIAWESLNGPIPEGLTVDHLCRNRGCQNVAHMELVTGAENTRRANTRTAPACRNGHPYPEGWADRPNKKKGCPTCQKAGVERHLARIASGEHVPQQRALVCVNGHPKDGPGGCRVCMRAARLRYEAKKRAAT